MDEKELIKKLEGVERPELSSAAQQRQLKLFLVSAKRSSWIGILLIAAPCLFLFGVILKYWFRFSIPTLNWFEEEMVRIDHSFFRFVPPLILVAGPLVALALNLLAIMHFHFDRARRELQVTVKIRILNLLIAAVCFIILAIIFMYVVGENGLPFLSHHPE